MLKVYLWLCAQEYEYSTMDWQILYKSTQMSSLIPFWLCVRYSLSSVATCMYVYSSICGHVHLWATWLDKHIRGWDQTVKCNVPYINSISLIWCSSYDSQHSVHLCNCILYDTYLENVHINSLSVYWHFSVIPRLYSNPFICFYRHTMPDPQLES